MTEQNDIETILDELESRYEASVDRLRKALTQYAEHGIRPDPDERDDGAFAYPELQRSNMIRKARRRPRTAPSPG